MNIVLCGMMGVGKSSVGIRIAEKTGRRWYDTDVIISGRHGKISDIFEFYGEAHFRALETEIVRELVCSDHLVISTGGGLVLKAENSGMLKENGKIFFLRANVETLLSRVHGDDTRPLLRDSGKTEDTLKLLLRERTPIYEQVSDFIVDTDHKTVEEVADEIIALAEGI